MNNIYYVYAYLRKSDGTPYYIGKGKGRRSISDHKHISVPKDKSKIIYFKENVSEEEALETEKQLILRYGRKDLNTGILLNRTDGGDGGTVSIAMLNFMRSDKNPMKVIRTNRGSFKVGHKLVWTKERNEKVRLSKIGNKNINYGNKAAANHLNVKVECSCGKSTTPGNIARWHKECRNPLRSHQ